MAKDKFRAADSAELAKQYNIASQFIRTISQIMENADGVDNISDLPNSSVPTDILLNLCICYGIMYDKLVEYQLVSKLTSTKTQH